MNNRVIGTIILSTVVVLTGIIAQFVYASATVIITNSKIEIEDFSVFVPCPNEEDGETVDLYGNLHISTHVTIQDDKTIVTTHSNPQNVIGVGRDSGVEFRGVGVTHNTRKLDVLPPFTNTFVNKFDLIGQGNANNFIVQEIIHLTINASGETTAEVNLVKVQCK